MTPNLLVLHSCICFAKAPGPSKKTVICFKVKILKTLKISGGCHIKTCRSLTRRAILKIPSTVL